MPVRDQTFAELWLEQLPAQSGAPVIAALGVDTEAGISQVVGVSALQGRNSVVVTWAPPAADTTIFYEVLSSENADLTDATSHIVGSTRFEFLEAEPDTTYYFVVRGRLGTLTGAYSETVSSQPGKINTEHVEPGSITQIESDDGFASTLTDPDILTTYTTIVEVTVTAEAGDIIMMWAGATFHTTASSPTDIRLALQFNEDSVLIVGPHDVLPPSDPDGGSSGSWAYYNASDAGADDDYTFRLIAQNVGSDDYDVEGSLLVIVRKA